MNAGRFGGGFLTGVVVAVALSGVFGGDGPDATTSTMPSTTVPEPSVEPWFLPGEALIGATVILPVGLEVEDGVAFFDYELAGLAPTLFGGDDDADTSVPVGDPLELPEMWELTTVAGDIVPATTGPQASSVRFELPSGDADVATISLVGWRIPVPFGDSVNLPVESGASGRLRGGTVTVSSVLEQSISTVVSIDLDHSDVLWPPEVALRSRDPRWRPAGRSGGLQLTWEGADAPDSIVIEDVGYELRPVSGSVVVYEAAVSP
jgi:hypothetical protein